MPARIGLHLGDIILKEGNVFGDPVNIAARIQALAAPGQIFLSGTIHQAIANKKEFTTRFIREENLKNVKEAVPVYELVQDGKAVPVIKKKRRSNTGRSVKTNVMIAASVILIAILAFIGTKFLQGRSSVIENSIAVLPFVDMSRTQDQEYFGDGLAEQIINSLTTVNELKVIGRTSSFQFKGQNLDLRKIGKTLNVGLILEGSIQVDGKKLRITAQLIRVSDNTHIWSQQYDRELTEIFRIQDDIALQITDRLKIALTDQQKQNLAMRETDPAAYQLFLKGTHAYRQQDFLKSIDYQLAAIKIDSLFALPYAYISLSKAWIISRSRDFQNVGAIESAKEYALKSVELAKTPEGYSALGLISWRIERRFATAKEYFEKSLEGNSNSSLIKNRFAYYLVWSGEFERARQLAQEAMVSDP